MSDDLEPAIDEALARSVVYRALTLGLRRPSAPGLGPLVPAAGRTALMEAAMLLDARSRLGRPFLPTVETLVSLPAPADAQLAAAHARLFGHSRGLVCPFETEYGAEGAFRQPQELADIAGTYLAFGLRPVTGIDERVDHVACQCEFMDFLARKDAFLLASGDGGGEGREVAHDAARGFLRDHLGRFGRAFATRLMKEDPAGFHGALGAVLFRFLGLECERLGVPPGPATLELRAPVPDETLMACGSTACASELIALPRRARP